MLLKLMFIYLCAAFLLITFMVGEYTLLVLPPPITEWVPQCEKCCPSRRQKLWTFANQVPQ